MKKNERWVAAALVGLSASMVCEGLLAQALEEIVVTARRQGVEKLMDTPLAITAFDADAIEAKAISSLQDIANLTPGMSFFNPIGEALSTPVIRGVVPQDIWGENAAAIFIDGVYVSGRQGLNFSQLDLERIEVLKGPQSSAYGRNAFSGAINYVTKPPSDVFSSKVEVEAGNRGRQKGMLQLSGPIWGDSLTGRVSLLYDDWDGSYDNTASWRDIGGYTYRSYQGKLRWRPTDKLDVNLAVYHSKDDIDDFAIASVLTNCEPRVLQTTQNVSESSPQQARLMNWCGRLPKLKSLPDALDPDTFDETLYPDGPLPLRGSIKKDALPQIGETFGQWRSITRTSLSINWNTDHGDLNLLTGYSYLNDWEDQDFNRTLGYGTPLVVCPTVSNIDPPQCDLGQPWRRIPVGVQDNEGTNRITEWSQELRFTSPRDQRLRWQTGGYYYHLVDNDHKQGLPIIHTKNPLPDWFDISPTGNWGIGPVALPTALAIGSYIMGPGFTDPDRFGGMDPLKRWNTKARQKSWSVFGAMDFDVTDRLKTRLELRHTEDHRWTDGYNYTPCMSPTPGSAFPASEDLPVADCGSAFFDLRILDPVGYDTWVKLADGEACNPGAVCIGNYQQAHVDGIEGGSVRFSTTTGRIGLDYKLDNGWLLYGSVAVGKKPGGIQVHPSKEVVNPGGAMGVKTIVNRFDPEKITAYELGIKGYTPDRRIRVDMAVFFNNWRDVVLRQLTDTDPETGLGFRQPLGLNVNAGNAHVFGWELTTDVGLTDNLTGRLTVGYTDSTMTKGKLDSYALFPSFYTNDPSCQPSEIQQIADPRPETTRVNEAQDAKASACRQLSGDIAGNTQMRQPPWTASLSLDYKRQLFGDWDIFSSLTGNFIDKQYLGNDNMGWIPPRAVVNLTLGVSSPRYTVKAWVRNLFDDDKPISGYYDILWSNDQDIYASIPTGQGSIRDISTFDDFPPMRVSMGLPSLRTWGLSAQVRFGGELK